MNRRFLPALLLLAYALTPILRAAETVEIKLATIMPVGTSAHKSLMEMRAAWQKAAGPALKLTIYAGMADGEPLLVRRCAPARSTRRC